MVLYREIYTDDVKMFERHYIRIKIFKDEGKKFADVEIPYVEKYARIEDIKARTVQPTGATVEFQGPVFDKEIFKAKGVKLQAKAFTLPGVQVGSIIEYSYTSKWKQGLSDVVKNPGNYLITGVHAVPTARWVINHELFTRRARFTIRPYPKANIQWATVRLPSGNSPRTQPDGTIQLEVENVPETPEEDYMPPEAMLNQRVHWFYLVGFASTPEWFWRDQGKQRAESLEKFIGKHGSMERAVQQIVSPSDTAETKLRKIYARVQQLRYLSYERPRTEKEQKQESLKENKSVEDILNRGYAYANEVNFLFVALARAAGFEAKLVELTSRENGLFVPQVFDTGQLDAMVVMVQVNGNNLYFDPATRYCPYGLVPWAETGVPGILLDPGGGQFVQIHSPKSDAAVIERNAKLKVLADGGVEAKLELLFKGQEALTRRLAANHQDDIGRRKLIEDEIKDWLPPGSKVELDRIENWESSEQPLRVESHLHIPHLTSVIGHRMLLQPAVFEANRRTTFQHARRVHPVYFRHAYQKVDHLQIELPEGFRIESLPAPKNEKTSWSGYQREIQSQQGGFRVDRRFDIQGFIFNAAYYPELRSFFDKVGAGDDDRVVLQMAQVAHN